MKPADACLLDHHVRERQYRLAAASLLGLLLLCTGPSPAAAVRCPALACQGYSPCHTPASAPPRELWGQLRPVDGRLPVHRDSTDFNEYSPFYKVPYWQSLDIENGWLFAAAGLRFQMWELPANTGLPNLHLDLGIEFMDIVWGADEHTTLAFQDVDAPPGVSDVVALAGSYGIGLVVFDTSDKKNPTIKYQDNGPGNPPLREAEGVYATTIAGRHYAFMATNGEGGGLQAYDLTAAQELRHRCTEAQPERVNCPGVYLGQVGNRETAKFVDGAGNLVATSAGSEVYGLQIFDVGNPADWNREPPQLRLEALTSESIFGIALWQQGPRTYLALRTLTEGRIYDISCVQASSCHLGAPLATLQLPFALPSKVTFSRSQGKPFLYFAHGTEQPCAPAGGRQALYDVQNPAAPVDISPRFEIDVEGESVDYWGWYDKSAGSVHGFNHIVPRVGKFNGLYFYRAAKGILDVHRRLETSGNQIFSDDFESGTSQRWTLVP